MSNELTRGEASLLCWLIEDAPQEGGSLDTAHPIVQSIRAKVRRILSSTEADSADMRQASRDLIADAMGELE